LGNDIQPIDELLNIVFLKGREKYGSDGGDVESSFHPLDTGKIDLTRRVQVQSYAVGGFIENSLIEELAAN
jgi:hypothetical protein